MTGANGPTPGGRPPVGIMQGRLLPPIGSKIQAFPGDRWAEEFPAARAAGLNSIEWIYELESADSNPLSSDHGIRELLEAQREHTVTVRSLCADFLMEEPLMRVEGPELSARVQRLRWILERSAAVGIRRVVLPFVDASAIRSREDHDVAVAAIRDVLPTAERLNIDLHLETSLAPGEFRELLDELQHASVGVNYDTGNSASLGYDPREEFAAYGSRIRSVHIKDRKRGGVTVPLGTGDADFDAVFGWLRNGYSGDLILQVARGEPGDEVAWTRHNKAFVVDGLDRTAQRNP